MPFLYSQTLIFEGPGHGATEKWYFQTTTDDVGAAASAVVPILDFRAALLGKQWILKAQRVSLLENDAGDKIVRRSDLKEFVKPGNLSQKNTESEISLQCTAADITKRFRKLVAMVGPWNAIFPSADVFEAVPVWLTKFVSWRDQMIALNMGWLSVSEDNPDTYDVIGYTFNPVTGITTYEFGEDVPWDAINRKQRVSIEFSEQRSPLDGVQLVVPSTARFAKTLKPRPAFPFVQPGVMRLLEPTFIGLKPNSIGPTGTIDPHKPVERKRGKSLLEPRARRPVLIRY